MKRFSVFAFLAAALFAGGCGTSRPPAAQVPETTPAQIPASGRAVVAVLGNRKTCGYCVKLWKQPLESAVEAELPGADVVDADKTAAPSLYALYRPAAAGFAWPLARVFGKDGRLIGEFSARNLTPAAFAAKVRALCPECAEAPMEDLFRITDLYRSGNNSAAVICGLTRVDPSKYGGWTGDCPGCDVDAQVFAAACESNRVSYELLLNSQCAYPNVLGRARHALTGLTPGGLLILYFSGHGGQVSAAAPGEADGKDETLCLWDGPLRDDDVWRLLCEVPQGIRIWMITDSCHSGTNYRGKPHSYAKALRSRSVSQREPDLLHWGGCADGRYSYGTSQGGTFTTALVDSYIRDQSYAAWFAAAARRMPAAQQATCEFTGDDFRRLPAFR